VWGALDGDLLLRSSKALSFDSMMSLAAWVAAGATRRVPRRAPAANAACAALTGRRTPALTGVPLCVLGAWGSPHVNEPGTSARAPPPLDASPTVRPRGLR
jgi:hypothetical protein